jgi:putative spermidine/putrescine transport system ATP-binding protein
MEGHAGVVREVVYLGAVTRYVVELDGGETLTAVRQNLETSASEVLAERGRRVQLAWRPEQLAAIGPGPEENQEEELK